MPPVCSLLDKIAIQTSNFPVDSNPESRDRRKCQNILISLIHRILLRGNEASSICTGQKTQRREHGEDSEGGAKEGKGLLSGVATAETRRPVLF